MTRASASPDPNTGLYHVKSMFCQWVAGPTPDPNIGSYHVICMCFQFVCRSVKVWGLGAPTPHFSLEGHERGVNGIDYYPGGDRPYLLSGKGGRVLRVLRVAFRCVVLSRGSDDIYNTRCSVILFRRRLRCEGGVRGALSCIFGGEGNRPYSGTCHRRASSFHVTIETTHIC